MPDVMTFEEAMERTALKPLSFDEAMARTAPPEARPLTPEQIEQGRSFLEFIGQQDTQEISLSGEPAPDKEFSVEDLIIKRPLNFRPGEDRGTPPPRFIKQGLANTTLGIALNKGFVETPEDFTALERIGAEVVGFVADPISYLTLGIGGVAGKQAGKGVLRFLGAKGAQALQKGVSTGTMLGLLSGEKTAVAGGTIGEVLESGGKSFAVGLATGPVSFLPKALQLPGEILAFAEAGAVVEGKLLPTADDFIQSAGVILGIKGTNIIGGALWKAARGAKLSSAELDSIKNIPPDVRGPIAVAAAKRAVDRAVDTFTENPSRTNAEKLGLDTSGELSKSEARTGLAERVKVEQKGEPDGTTRTQPEAKETDTGQPQAETPTKTPPETSAKAEEVAPSKERPPTSIKNETVDRERSTRGLPAAMEPARRSFGTVWDDAMRIVEEKPHRQDALIAELKDNPRSVTDTEDALLLQRQIVLQNEYDKTLGRLEKAKGAEVVEHQAQEEVLLQELLQLYDINKAVGTATARGLNARKLLAAEDFTLVKMVAQKRKAKAVDALSVEDEVAVKAQQRKIVGLEQQLREHTERIDKLESDRTSIEVTKEIVTSERQGRAQKRTEAARAEVEAAWKDLESKLSDKLFANPLDPAILGSATKLARSYIKLGVSRFQDFVDQVIKRIGKERAGRLGDTLRKAYDAAAAEEKPKPKRALESREAVSRYAKELAKFFVSTGVADREPLIDAVHGELSKALPKISRRETMDAISGYGEFRPLSKDEVDVQLRDAKGQMQQIAKLEDMQAGQAPLKTGQERRIPSDEERRLIQQVNEMKKRSGFDVTDPETQLRSSLQAVKTRLRNRIADLEQQIGSREKTVKDRTEVILDKEAQGLIRRRNALKQQFDEIFGRPELTDGQRVKVATIATERSIAELERRIVERDVKPRSRTSKAPATEELQALRDRRDALREEFKELQDQLNPKKTPEERSLASLKTRLRTRIADFQDRLARKEFSPKARKETKLDKEAEKLRFEAEQAKAEFVRGLEADVRARRTLTQKIFGAVPEALNTSRAMLTSLDFSATLRQGGAIVFGHPVRGAKALGTMFRSAASKAGASRARNELDMRPNASLYKRAGLELTDPDGRLSQQEEVYMARISKKIPFVAGSERAFVAFLNRIRADSFDTMVATLGKDGTITLAESKVIANYVNVATGRGNLGKFQAASVPLATVFFAPKYVISRFQYLTGQPLWKGTAGTRKLVAAEYGRTLVGLGAFYSTAVAALYSLVGPPGDNEEWDIELDPRSSDFGKIRIGDTRIDPLFGLSQSTVIFTRLLAGETKRLRSGEIVPIRGDDVPFGGSTAAGVAARFLRTKLSPLFGTVLNILSGKNVIGEEVTALTTARDISVPISMRDILNYMKAHGIIAGVGLSLLEIFGVSVQHFEPPPPKRRRRRRRR